MWAPRHESLQVVLKNRAEAFDLSRDDAGYFSGILANITAGDCYQYRFANGTQRPDPAAAAQRASVHGYSMVVDPNSYEWQLDQWKQPSQRELVIYELHIGCFTSQGTFLAAIERLDSLVELGVTAIEVMPVAEAPGRWNWGYDGVGLFAVHRSFGRPDDFKAFVDACHQRNLAVILDVVYNHLGPEGNYLSEFGPYFTNKYHTPWGSALNFDGKDSRPVREFIVQNVLYWLDEFRLDGLRLDAIHFMFDNSDWKITDEIRQVVTEFEAAANRPIHLIAEANLFDADFLGPFPEGSKKQAYSAAWCDDIMHSIYSVAAPGIQLAHREYTGWNDLTESLETGFIYADAKPRRVDDAYRQQLTPDGSLAHLSSLICGLQTHDCVGNHPHGKRFHQLTSTETQQAAVALTMLYPAIPILFMGEERAADSPFRFFADFGDERLRKAVDKGRRAEYPRHEWKGAVAPSDRQAFDDCILTWPGDDSMLAWYHQLLRIRKHWLAESFLDATKMTVETDANRHTIHIAYKISTDACAFVVVRLAATSDRPVVFGSLESGEILADSQPGHKSRGEILLYPNHAIIGVGEISAGAN